MRIIYGIRQTRPQSPPLIGVVTHELRAEPAPAWGPAPGRSQRDRSPARLSLRLSYTQAVQDAGAIAVVLPAHGFVDDVAPLLDRLDGLLFSGGPDLDPATGEAPDRGQLVFHHQAVDELGKRLVPCAHAPDGTIEALFDPALSFCLGVQWHAELLTHRPEHAPLLNGLVAAATGAAAPVLRLAA